MILSTLDNLSRGTAALDKAYSNAIERIDGQLPEDRLLARRTISWLSYAQRPLITQELCHALAVIPGERAPNNDNIYDMEDIISVCAGLVTIDKESKIIRLMHYTTQEYFEQIRLEWNPSALEEMASICLTYLAFDTLRSGSCRTIKDFEERIRTNAFLDYAARHWAEHVRPVEETVSELVLAFLRDDALVSCSAQIMSMKDSILRREDNKLYPDSTTGLHLSARFGLVLLSRMLLTADSKESIKNVNAKDGHGRTPLFWAAENGHKPVVKLLLETGQVEVDSKEYDGRTPLSFAAENGHDAVVKLLIETGQVEVDSREWWKYGSLTPLSWAAQNGHEAIVKLLLETSQVEVDFKDRSAGRTPLSRAAENGNEAVVKLLLEKGQAKANLQDYQERTPLSWAVEKGHEAVIKLLLQTNQVEVNLKDKRAQTPLSLAAENGNEAIVKLLLERG
jgi:ankyrin repeat protein